MESTWLARANGITGCRTALIIPLTYAILNLWWLVASLIFVLAVVTDVFDGHIARKYNEVSPLGGLLDHGTDAVMVTAGAWALAQLNIINPYLWPLIILAFTQYMLDSKALAGKTLRTSIIGRSNGVAYFALLGTVVIASSLALLPMLWLSQFMQFIVERLVPIAAWIMVASTLVSMVDRLVALRQ